MNRENQDKTSPSTPFLTLRRADQAAVAIGLLLCMALMALWWIARDNGAGRLVEADCAAKQKQEFSFTLDINTAPWPELAQLPGIGEITARKIVASREKNGPFADHDDLTRVRGIGKKTVARIRPFLRQIKD